jgi:hypothetical protein
MAIFPVVYDDAADKYRPHNAGVDPPIAGSGSYVHTQSVPSAVWSIPHNLGTTAVEVETFDQYGVRKQGSPDWSGATTAVIAVNFAVPMAGTAYVRPL